MPESEALDGAPALESAILALKEYDTEPEWRKKRDLASKATSLLAGVFKAALDRREWSSAGVVLHFLKELEQSGGPFFLGFAAEEGICSALEKNRKPIRQEVLHRTIDRAKHLRETAVDSRTKVPYLSRERFLEQAIRMIWGLFEKDLGWPYQGTWSKREACHFIARCYLDRSRLILPKGSSIPQKKLEALQKAEEWANKKGVANESDIESLKLLIEIGLERRRWDPSFSKDHVNDLIKRLSQLGFTPSPTSFLDWEIIDRGRAAGILPAEFDEMLMDLNGTSPAMKGDAYIPLLKACAAFRLFNAGSPSLASSDFMDRVSEAINTLYSVPFSSFIWNETIDLLKKIKQSGSFEDWPNLAIHAWRVCVEREQQVRLGLHLRMYWARQLDLYDLAFQAALEKEDMKTAAEIADSLKSRPTIKWLNLERSLSGENKKELEKWHEIESQWSMNRYIPDYQERVKDLTKQRQNPTEQRLPTDVPAGWAAVHFYIDQLQKGHAIIFDGNSKNWIYHSFALHDEGAGTDLWNDFESWQSAEKDMALRDMGLGDRDKAFEKAEHAPYLEKLCKGLGKALEFLFDKTLPSNLLLIPYGFLHVAPIHAALREDRLLLQEKSCLYLPSWSLLGAETPVSGKSGRALLLNWGEDETFEGLFNDWPDDGCKSTKIKDATGQAVRGFLTDAKTLELLAIICHGNADPLNPYNSRLELKQYPLTHADLYVLDANLSGTRVYLGACESDLAPSKRSLVDEHLSMASAFLNKGAHEVAGTLWRAGTELVKEVIESAVASPVKPFRRLIQEKQVQWWSESSSLNGCDGIRKLYFLAPFRVVGFPD